MEENFVPSVCGALMKLDTHPPQSPLGSRSTPTPHHQGLLAFIYLFIFLVLPVHCYQPISLHPRAHMLSHVTPWTAARQAPLFMDFSRQEYWSGLPFPSPQLLVFKTTTFFLEG